MCMCMESLFSYFYAVELTIHFLAEEGFLNKNSDILLNLTPEVWIVRSIEYFLF